MAGASIGENEENPVAINVVAMVDVIFCLCVFFMCSFRFKQLEGKFDSWLPKSAGLGAFPAGPELIEEIRVAMYWDEATQKTVRQFKMRKVEDDGELQEIIKSAYADFVRLNKPDTPVIVDADHRVPWREVVNVVNLARRNNIDKIEFAFGGKPPSK